MTQFKEECTKLIDKGLEFSKAAFDFSKFVREHYKTDDITELMEKHIKMCDAALKFHTAMDSVIEEIIKREAGESIES